MAQVRAFSLGGLGSPCCCGCSTTICLKNCSGTYISGATVTIKTTGGTTVSTGTTGDASNCSVQSLTKVSGGTGYFSVPTVVFTGGGGSGAAATATIDGAGHISTVVLTNGGSRYSSAPTISFSGGGGSGASWTANMGCGCVTLPISSSGTYDVVISSSSYNATWRTALSCGGTTTIGSLCAQVNVLDCKTSTGIAGVTVTMSSGAGDFKADTDSNGCAVIPYPSAGSYTFSATYDGVTPSRSITAINGGVAPCSSTPNITVSFYYNCFTVKGCIGDPVAGVTMTMTGYAGSKTTDSNGQAQFFMIGGQSITYTTSKARFNDTSTGPTTVAAKATTCAPTNITLTADSSSFVCSCLCNIPLCKTLDFTDSVLGSTTLAWALSGGINTWTGTLSASYAGCTGTPSCAAKTVTVTYTFQDTAVGPPSVCGTVMTRSVKGTGGGGTVCPDDAGTLLDSRGVGAVSSSCDPFSYSGSIVEGCPSSTCAGCGSNAQSKGIWGQTGSVTVNHTISDTC